jgi:hypothetical protein
MTQARRRPFDAFEVHKVAEYNDNHGATYCETIDDDSAQEGADDEAVRQFWTVYGHRSFPVSPRAPSIEGEASDDSGLWIDGVQVTRSFFDERTAWLRHIRTEDTEGLGATAIADFDDVEDARDLAYALADGKPIYDYAREA